MVVVLGGVLAVPALALMGRDAALDSDSGRLVGVVTDPAAPGYQVIVEPTPTLLLIHTHQDRLEAVTFMALSSASTGSALDLPSRPGGGDRVGTGHFGGPVRRGWPAGAGGRRGG